MSQLQATVLARNDAPDRATRLKLYRAMACVRLVEKRAYDLFLQNQIKGTSHLALGQEAIAAGFGTSEPGVTSLGLALPRQTLALGYAFC